jgi:hypothetical protein
MTTGINKLAIVGMIVAALVVAAPASAQLALPDGYAPPSAEPSGYSPQALKALGERSQAMAQFYTESTGVSPQALQALGQRWQAMGDFYTGGSDAFDRALRNLNPTVVGDVGRTAPDVIEQPTRALIAIDSVGRSSGSTGSVGVVSDDSFDWNTFGIAAGTGALLVALCGAGLIGLRARGRVAHP